VDGSDRRELIILMKEGGGEKGKDKWKLIEGLSALFALHLDHERGVPSITRQYGRRNQSSSFFEKQSSCADQKPECSEKASVEALKVTKREWGRSVRGKRQQ